MESISPSPLPKGPHHESAVWPLFVLTRSYTLSRADCNSASFHGCYGNHHLAPPMPTGPGSSSLITFSAAQGRGCWKLTWGSQLHFPHDLTVPEALMTPQFYDTSGLTRKEGVHCPFP